MYNMKCTLYINEKLISCMCVCVYFSRHNIYLLLCPSFNYASACLCKLFHAYRWPLFCLHFKNHIENFVNWLLKFGNFSSSLQPNTFPHLFSQA